MLDHVTIGVSDIERSKAFYDQALKLLAIERLAVGAVAARWIEDRASATRASLKLTRLHIDAPPMLEGR